jgi:hypothetical protein
MSAPFILSWGYHRYYRNTGWWRHRPLRSQLHREILHHHLAQRWLLDGNDSLWCRCHLHLLLRDHLNLLRGLFDPLLGGHLNILRDIFNLLLLLNILSRNLNLIIRCNLNILSRELLDLLRINIFSRHILSILVEFLLHHLRKFSLDVVLVRSPLL